MRRYVATRTLVSIYRCLIARHLTKGLSAQDQACNSHLDKLLKLQKCTLRFIYFSDFKQQAVPLFIEAGVLPLKFSYFKIIANLMCDIRHKNEPGRIQNSFKKFPIYIPIILGCLLQIIFVLKAPNSQFS